MGPEAIFDKIKEKDAEGVSPVHKWTLLAKQKPLEWFGPRNGTSKHTVSAHYIPSRPVYRLEESRPCDMEDPSKEHLILKDFLEKISQDFPFNTSPTIEDIIREIAKEVSDEEWKKLPHDIVDRLDYHLYGADEE